MGDIKLGSTEVVKNAYGLLAFIRKSFEYRIWDNMLQWLGTSGILCVVLHAAQQQGCDQAGEGAEKILRNFAWIGRFELYGEIG